MNHGDLSLLWCRWDCNDDFMTVKGWVRGTCPPLRTNWGEPGRCFNAVPFVATGLSTDGYI